MYFDEIAAKGSAFGKRIAHGYLVLSAAAGLFVSPVPRLGARQLWPRHAALR
jgi:oxepin-CoA hydrolase/3-oxo-5,6-dehydrosuberyl-CoA semialdehyde dehydrogenase